MFPSAASDGRSAWTARGLRRFGLLHRAGTPPPGERRMNTPIDGERSVAQAPERGGQSLAQTDRSRPPAVASDFPGFQLNGSEARCRPNADPGRAIPARTRAAASTLNTRRRARPDIDG